MGRRATSLVVLIGLFTLSAVCSSRRRPGRQSRARAICLRPAIRSPGFPPT